MSLSNFSNEDGTIRCERRGCSKRFTPSKFVAKTGPTQKRFCSASCKVLEYQYRTGKKTRREFGVCQNGHERTPENTSSYIRDGYKCTRCLVCDREAAKRRYDATPEKFRQRVLVRYHRLKVTA